MLKKRADDYVKTAQSYPSGGFDAASRREENGIRLIDSDRATPLRGERSIPKEGR